MGRISKTIEIGETSEITDDACGPDSLGGIAAACFADAIDRDPGANAAAEILTLVGAAAVLAGLHGIGLDAVLQEAAAGHAHGVGAAARIRQ
jgi:hypothetical protein